MSFFNYTKSVYTKNFALEQIQKIIMYNTSDSVWGISDPHVNLIKKHLNNNNIDLNLTIYYSFDRPVILYFYL